MSARSKFADLQAAAPAILPSLLLCDFGNLEREVAALEAAGVPGLHLDVMDGHFVPNLTYGMPIVAAIRRLTKLPVDVHLMIADPLTYAPQFCDAGADAITFHVEAVDDPRPVLEAIRRFDVAAGLAINPATPLEEIDDCLDLCDLVLVMSVKAGFGGQKFQTSALEKLRRLRNRVGQGVALEIDGGINAATIAQSAAAGAELFVVGSAIFNQQSYRDAVSQLRALAVAAVT
jgi:ribulose-phosphate 3-epimerase